MGFRTGEDRLLLWLPMTITHVIDDDSPLCNWKSEPEDALKDADTTIVVMVRLLIPKATPCSIASCRKLSRPE